MTTDDEDLAWKARSFRDHGYDVKRAAEPAGAGAEAALHPQHGRLELPHDGDAVGHRPGGAGADGHLEHAGAPPQRPHPHRCAARIVPQVKYLPVDTPERQNGWYVMAFSLDIENMNCDIQQFVDGGRGRGRAVLEGLLAAVPHRARLPRAQGLRALGFPFTSKEYADPASVDYSKVEVPNALWHESHTFTCFRLSHLHRRRHAPDRQCAGEGN